MKVKNKTKYILQITTTALIVIFNSKAFCYQAESNQDMEIESIKSSTQYGESNLVYKDYRPEKNFTYKEFNESRDGITVNVKTINTKNIIQNENKWIMRGKKCAKCPIIKKPKKTVKKRATKKIIKKTTPKPKERIRTIVKKIIIYRESEKEVSTQVNVNVINQLNESEIRCE